MSETPNVVIESPAVRRALNAVISYGTLGVGLVAAVDAASSSFDLSAYTLPAAAGLGYLLAALTAGVTIPNIPAQGAAAYVPQHAVDEALDPDAVGDEGDLDEVTDGELADWEAAAVPGDEGRVGLS